MGAYHDTGMEKRKWRLLSDLGFRVNGEGLWFGA